MRGNGAGIVFRDEFPRRIIRGVHSVRFRGTSEIDRGFRERKLAPGLKGKTPERTLAAQLAVSAKRGRFVERTEPGKFRLKRGS